MAYQTKWSLLDRNHKVVQDFERICFSNHLDRPFTDFDVDQDKWDKNNAADPSRKPGITHYFRYNFDNAKVSDAEMTQYFRFVRATPEFAHLMPRSIKEMVATKTYTANLTKVNGLQLFTILTVLRAVVEEPKIVWSVIQFDHRRQHALPHLSILKAAGQKSDNYHHWITGSVHFDNLAKGINNYELWDDPAPALDTGLIGQIHNTFQHEGDGYYTNNPVPKNWADLMLAAQPRKPRIDKPVIKRKTMRPIIPAHHHVASTAGPLPEYAPW